MNGLNIAYEIITVSYSTDRKIAIAVIVGATFALLTLFVIPLISNSSLPERLHNMRWLQLYVGADAERYNALALWLNLHKVKHRDYSTNRNGTAMLRAGGGWIVFTNIRNRAELSNAYRIDIRKRDKERVLQLLQSTDDKMTVSFDLV